MVQMDIWIVLGASAVFEMESVLIGSESHIVSLLKIHQEASIARMFVKLQRARVYAGVRQLPSEELEIVMHELNVIFKAARCSRIKCLKRINLKIKSAYAEAEKQAAKSNKVLREEEILACEILSSKMDRSSPDVM